ncbi:MAG: hypothetical protein QXQ69_01295 [Candidatus Aenigmatarchaeota archaeon]
MYESIFLIVTPIPVVILFSFLSFYLNKFLKNVKKNEKLSWTLVFLHPSASKALKVLIITLLFFSIVFIARTFINLFLTLPIPLGPIATYVLLLGFVYFFKTLAEITEKK